MTTPESIAIQKALQNQNIKKATEHLLGICHGITADQMLNDSEIIFLNTWIKQNQDVVSTWPGKTIARRIHEILADGIITDEERASLLITLEQACSSDFLNTGDTEAQPADIPFDDDPHIIFPDNTFCFTGEFLFGTRAACHRAVEKLTARTKDNITTDIDYLVIGSRINSNWKHTSFGRKIETAVKYIDKGHGIAIVSEQQWIEALSHH